MSAPDYRLEIDGYREIQNEIAVLRKYAIDYTPLKGKIERIIDLYHPKRLTLRITDIIRETPSARTLRLTSLDGYLPPFQAGQYLTLTVETDGVRTSRPYSISSPPNQTGYYDITIRRVEDGFVSAYLLDEARVGEEFTSTSPAGHFYYNPLFHGQDLVFLAGGSGITPFMSMIREVTDRGLERRIHLIYGSRDDSDVIFREELEDRAARHPNIKLTFVISEPPPGYRGRTGLITKALLQELLPERKERMVYLCGPEAMYRFCLPILAELGIPARRIRTEVFGLPRDITTHDGWPAQIKAHTEFKVSLRGRQTIPAKAGEPLLIALERAGLVLPAACRSGECSLCRLKLISGRVFQPASARLRKSDRRFGYIHSCAAYPLEDLEILI